MFDALRPPDPDLLSTCVHCGFCLPACPTYQLWGEEMDSPRGRIDLMRSADSGEATWSPTFVQHFDACLGCMACVTACPSGVQYGPLLEATRAQIERHAERGPADRAFRAALFALFPYRRRLRVAAAVLWAAQRTGLTALAARGVDLLARRSDGAAEGTPPGRPGVLARLRALMSLAPPLTRADLAAAVPPLTAARGEERLRVGLVLGCVQAAFLGRVNTATVDVLAADGCTVVAPPHQPCCGALGLHAGRDEHARGRARRMISAMEDARVDRVVVNAAGCGSALKEYGHLLADDPRWADRAGVFAASVRDVHELLAEIGPAAVRQPVAQSVAYHDACHLAHAQGIRVQPRAVLAAIPGLELREVGDDTCCGSAGIYNLIQPEAAEDLGRRKAAAIAATGATVVATGNPGCLLQLQRHLPEGTRVVHPVELLAESIHGAAA